jgi:hypothetical protein
MLSWLTPGWNSIRYRRNAGCSTSVSLEDQPHNPQEGANPYQQANSYGTDDPAIQASIEQVRTEASEERRRNRERLERYVKAGLSADDAEAMVEFEQAARDQQRRTDLAETVDRHTDDQLIHFHITEALREDRPIDDATARTVASQLHGGQASPLYALASSGALVDGLTAELDTWRADKPNRCRGGAVARCPGRVPGRPG